MWSYLYLLNITYKHITHIGGDTERRGCLRILLTIMWQEALLCPVANRTDRVCGFSGFSARCQSSEGCYLSRWEVLEVVEGQVGDYVSSVPDEWLMTSSDGGGGQNFAVPQTKRLLLLRSHAPQVSVNGPRPINKIEIKLFKLVWYSGIGALQ